METAKRLLTAGADILVTGSFVFKSLDPLQAIENLKAL
jgi:pentose-5-phosphate-3-epimerase